MLNDKEFDFLRDDHGKMVGNLNKISDDLLKAKWYFLTTISAIGSAYYYVLSQDNKSNEYFYFAICLFGNIVFWVLSEYIVSHGFLFRSIQAKVARMEKEMYTPGYPMLVRLIKDPTDKSNFIETENGAELLKFHYLLPDQFIPLYWASLWSILINTVVGLYFSSLAKNSDYDRLEFLFLLISIPLVWKIWMYHRHKLEEFVSKKTCCFEIVVCKDLNNKDKIFYEFPQWWIRQYAPLFIIMLMIALAFFFVCFPVLYGEVPFYLWSVSSASLLFFFWPVIVGIAIHILHCIFGFGEEFKKCKYFRPPISHNCETIFVDFQSGSLANLRWTLCLLYHIV